jgi:hypothetical protein
VKRGPGPRHAEDDDQEKEGRDHLEYQCREKIVLAEIASPPAIGSESAVPA